MTQKSFLLPIGMMVLALLACAAPNVPVGDAALFKDDFSSSDSGWETGTDQDGSIEYVEGELVAQIFTEHIVVWSSPPDQLENVHVEVTAKNVSGNDQVAFGLICNRQANDNYYYFAITPAGEYAIAKTLSGKDDIFLTNKDRWGVSDLIPKAAASYQLGADCGSGTLNLYVNGKKVDSAADADYGKGEVGVIAWRLAEKDTRIHFDDFVTTALAK